MFFVTAFIGDAGQGWAERGTLTAVLFTALAVFLPLWNLMNAFRH